MFSGIDPMAARFVRHSFAPHSHDELMIGVMHAGVKSFRRGRSRAFAAPGSLSVVNPGEMHTGELIYGSELVYAAIYVTASAQGTMLAPLLEENLIVREPVVNDRDVWRCLAAAHRLGMSGDDGAAAEEAMVFGISLLFERFGARRFNRFRKTVPKGSQSRRGVFAGACLRSG